jgi:8-oxo-dGTP diphosphatase
MQQQPTAQPENPFEAGTRKVIPAVLVYVRRGSHILMIHRNAKNPGRVDYHEGKWNGLGGKCELDESPRAAAIREIFEESGLKLEEARLHSLGVVQFPNFKPHKNEDWMVFVWSAELESQDPQEPARSSAEGDLHWIPETDLLSLNVWPGDRHFIPYVLQGKPFVGTIWYEQGQVARYEFCPLSSPG